MSCMSNNGFFMRWADYSILYLEGIVPFSLIRDMGGTNPASLFLSLVPTKRLKVSDSPYRQPLSQPTEMIRLASQDNQVGVHYEMG